MNVIELRTTWRRSPRSRRYSCFAFALLTLAGWLGATAAESTPLVSEGDAAADNDAVISLAAYNVKADRIEDFGLRVDSRSASGIPWGEQKLTSLTTVWFAKYAPVITAIVPNTAAAKAGLQPGERLLKSDGQSMVGGPFSREKFDKLQKKKWAEANAGKTSVTWTLEVESPATKAVRTVKLVVPTPAPRWGASIWRAPVGRSASHVMETGPLAERSRAVLDHGIWALSDARPATGIERNVAASSAPTGYEWRIENERHLHRIFVTQLGGRTRILLETFSSSTGRRLYLTSPSGVLENAWRWGREENIALMKAKTAEAAAKVGEIPLAEARVGFDHEVDLWSTKVGKVSARWPFEVKPGYDPDAIFAVLAPKTAAPGQAAATIRPFAEEFLKLRPATEAERAMFADAYGRLGTEQDQWAYTETSHGLADKRSVVTRVDPSKPEAERSVLLSIDGKPPTPTDVQRWRDEGGDVPKPLGDIPPLGSVVDVKQLRVFKEEAGAIVFELPIRKENVDFPAEKFQALFRVNKATRALDDMAVKLRESFRVAGVVKVIEAGFEARFQAFDPALAPQPVSLRAGGGVRVLLVKLSRSFEATRTDFKRVVPFDDAAEPAK